jgi:hypothetical protein
VIEKKNLIISQLEVCSVRFVGVAQQAQSVFAIAFPVSAVAFKLQLKPTKVKKNIHFGDQV